jgi:NAD+ synthase
MPDSAFSRDVLDVDSAAVVAELACAIRRDVQRTLRRRGVVVGVSGGVDSAVTLGLCVRAVGAERVLAVLLPERESSPDSVALGRLVVDHFGTEMVIEDLTAALEALGCYRRRDAAIRRVVPAYGDGWGAKLVLPGDPLEHATLNVFHLTVIDPQGREQSHRLEPQAYLEIVAASNFKQRARMAMAYHHAEARNYCVAGTSNRTEHDQGFFVKHGDGGYDVGPITHLFKTQVYQLADFLAVPAPVIGAVPTTDTYSAASSQEEFFFRMPLETVDLLCYGMEHGIAADVVAPVLGLRSEQVARGYADLARRRRTTAGLRAAPIHYD